MKTVFAVTDACAGCGACIKTCPEKAIRPAPRGHGSPLIVLADRCSGCAECAEVCPVSACVEIPHGSREPLAPAPPTPASGVGSRERQARGFPTPDSLLPTPGEERSDDL